ncbi:hypothetical protein ACWEQL_09630 [Kitasatospora sp. NPDC004240]
MTQHEDFRVGDVLSVACPFTPARVERGVTWDHLGVVWPWWRPDPDSASHWNGVVALSVDLRTREWAETELFRTDPPPERLEAGDPCLLGVPPTVVHVTEVDRFDPPWDTGWLPRPELRVEVLPRGVSDREVPEGSEDEGPCFEIHPGDGIPFTFELLFRPYGFLRPGDEVADAAGRALRFDGPWEWHAFDGDGAPAGPEWPLTLLTRDGTPAGPADAAEVAGATAAGSHGETLRRWTRLTDATPLGASTGSSAPAATAGG